MKHIKFLRRNTENKLRLGKKRKKNRKWRSPKGRDNKMRLRVKGRARTVEIGYKQENKNRGKIKNKIPIVVRNLNDIEKVRKENIIIIGKVGKKKKIEILKKIKEKNFEVFNADIEKIINQEIKKEK